MGKYKKSLVSKIREEKEYEDNQGILRDKYGISNQEIIVVEKTNMIKFLVRSIGISTRVISSIILLILAAIGLITICYPEIREPFLFILKKTISELKMLFNIVAIA